VTVPVHWSPRHRLVSFPIGAEPDVAQHVQNGLPRRRLDERCALDDLRYWLVASFWLRWLRMMATGWKVAEQGRQRT
jgi:hypothetical protein